MSHGTPEPDRSAATARSDRPLAVVTGATGFIGVHVCRSLMQRGWHVRGIVRTRDRASGLPDGVEPCAWDLEHEDPPTSLVRDARAIIHLAGRAHRMGAMAGTGGSVYARLNVHGTRSLLTAAREAGVERFVFVSSAKVLGEGDPRPYAHDAPTRPRDAYAASKAEAEQVVRAEADTVAWTIVRPVFVYGPGGKGNYPRLVKLARIASRIPLPLSGLCNRRSIVYVENLADLLSFCIANESTKGLTLPGVDTQSVSTPALLRAVSAPLGLAPRLYALPVGLLERVARLAGRAEDWRRLAGSFEVDATILHTIGWRAPISFEESFRRCAAAPGLRVGR